MNTAVAERQEAAPVAEIQSSSESAMMIQMIQRAAADPKVDVDKMERLMLMHERFVDRNSAASFNAAMVRAQQRIKPVARRAFNAQTNSSYAKLEDIDREISPIFTAEGFSLSFGTDDSPLAGHVRVLCDVMHQDGHTKQYKADLPLDSAGIAGKTNKTGVHAHGSTYSYARRYLTLMIFNVVMANEDDDGNATTEQAANDDLRQAVLADLLGQVERAASQEEVTSIWTSGVAILRAAKDQDGYEKLKAAVTARGTSLKSEKGAAQ